MKSFFSLRPILFNILAFLLICGGHVFADSIDLYGVQIPVDKKAGVNGNALKIDLLGSSRVVETAKAGDFVLSAYLQNKTAISKISVDSLEKIVRGALTEKNYRIASLVLCALMEHSQTDSSSWAAFLSSLPPQAIAAFQETIHEGMKLDANGELLAILLLQIGSSGPESIDETGKAVFNRFPHELGSVWKEEFSKLASVGDLQKFEKLLLSYEAIVGSENPEAQEIRRNYGKMLEAKAFFESGKDTDAIQMTVGLEAGGLFRLYFDSAATDRAEKQMLAKNYQLALLLLSNTDVEKRTPRTHALVEAALSGISDNQTLLLENVSLRAFLKILAGKDESIKNTFLRLLDTQAMSLVESGSLDPVIGLLSDISMLRPDPNHSNDEIRIKLSKAYA